MSEVARGEGASRSSWMAPTALALSLLGLLGAIAFWLVAPIFLAIAGTLLGLWARRSAAGGRTAQWAVILGGLAIVLNIGLIIAGAAGAF